MCEDWNGAKWIRRDKRLAIYARDGLSCVYCGAQDNLSLDHLRPRSAGGDNRARNLVTACRSCNMSRGDKPWWEFAGENTAKVIKRNRRRSIRTRRKRAKEILEQASSWNDAIASAMSSHEGE